MKSPSAFDLESQESIMRSSWSTKPNTSEREFVYWRTAITHSICVHIFANGLVCFIIITS